MKRKKTIGVIGFGNMGSSCAQAIASDTAYNLLVFDKKASKIKRLKKSSKVKDAGELIRKSNIVILAIKPQDFSAFLRTNRQTILAGKPLLVSLAAGVSIKSIQQSLPGIKIVRVMPNLAAKVKQALTFVAKNRLVKSPDLKEVKRIFFLMGEVIEGKEADIDKITALSGSGPGFIYYFMNSFYNTALEMGFGAKKARKIVNQTFCGSAELARVSDKKFSGLLKAIASPGGTTEAGIALLKKSQISKKIFRSIIAARDRAEKISSQLNQRGKK